VLALLSVVKREDFVPQALRSLAFADMELPLGNGQCMLAPRVEARMLQDLALQPHEAVLEIGAGSGYMAALLAHRARTVVSLEIDAGLAATAQTHLHSAGIHNATVRQADGAKAGAFSGHFEAIVLSGSVAEVPHALLSHLTVGGRLMAVVDDEPVMRATIVTRNSDTDFSTRQPWDTVAPRLQNFAQPSRFRF